MILWQTFFGCTNNIRVYSASIPATAVFYEVGYFCECLLTVQALKNIRKTKLLGLPSSLWFWMNDPNSQNEIGSSKSLAEHCIIVLYLTHFYRFIVAITEWKKYIMNSDQIYTEKKKYTEKMLTRVIIFPKWKDQVSHQSKFFLCFFDNVTLEKVFGPIFGLRTIIEHFLTDFVWVNSWIYWI